jgi:tetratricopeptide (TPR) repeat protein
MSETKRNNPYRFPGVASFEDDELSYKLFFGRHTASEKLLYYLLSENLTVLFSNSGYGKTSLLQTKVFRALKEREHFPVMIRFNVGGVEPAQMIKTRMLETALEQNKIGPYERSSPEWKTYYDDLLKSDLHTFFHKLEIWSPEYKLLTPVLVFDQFEEIFTLGHNNQYRSAFFDELATLINPSGKGRLNLRLLLSLREDMLGRLENLAEHIPSVFTNRFQLDALTRSNAEEAIRKPAEIVLPGVNFISKPFEFSDGAMKTLLDFLTSKQGEVTERSKEYVEPVQLQVICQELEERVVSGKIKPDANGKIIVTENDMGGAKGLQSILGNFYQKLLTRLENELSLSPEEIQAVRNVIEKDLILGGRRVPAAYETITNKPNVPKKAIDLLINSKLLKNETNNSGSNLVELSHDTLVKPIMTFYEKRRVLEEAKESIALAQEEEEKARNKRFKFIATTVFIIICFLCGFLWNQYAKADQLQKQSAQQRYYFQVLSQSDRYPSLAYRLALDGNKIDPKSGMFKDILAQYDSDSGWVTHELWTDGKIIAAGFSERKKQITAVDQSALYTWNDKGILKKKILFDKFVLDARILPDGKAIILCVKNYSEPNTIFVYDESGKVQRTLSFHQPKILLESISEDGKIILINNSLYYDGSEPVSFLKIPVNMGLDYAFDYVPGITNASFVKNDKQLVYNNSGLVCIFKIDMQHPRDSLESFPGPDFSDMNGGVSYVGGINDSLAFLSRKGGMFIWDSIKKAERKIKDNVSAFNISNDGKLILMAGSAECFISNDKGKKISRIKRRISTPQFAGFSDTKESALVGYANRLLIWYTGKADTNRMTLCSPYYYRMLGFSETRYTVGEIYDTTTTDGLLIALTNYCQNVLRDSGQTRSQPETDNLKLAVKEISELHKQLFRHPDFKSKERIAARKYELKMYSDVIEMSAMEIYGKETYEMAWYLLQARSDSICNIALLTDTIDSPENANNLIQSFVWDGQFFVDSVRKVDKAIECFNAAGKLMKAFMVKYPGNPSLLFSVEDIAEGLTMCYKYKGREAEGRVFLTQAVALVETKPKDQTWNEFSKYFYKQQGCFYRDSLHDYPMALSSFRKSIDVLDKRDAYRYNQLVIQIGTTYLLSGDLDSATIYADKSLKADKTFPAYAIKTSVYLLKNDLSKAKREYNNGLKEEEGYGASTMQSYLHAINRTGKETDALKSFSIELKKK